MTPRRVTRDQPETLAAYLCRTGQSAGPASAKTTTRALAYYTTELAILTRSTPAPRPAAMTEEEWVLRTISAA
jgi:hypothetical protein